MQLPPLIANPAQPQQRAGAAPVHGLLRPLFARLVDAGHPVHLLRRQYRYGNCMISNMLCDAVAAGSLLEAQFASQQSHVHQHACLLASHPRASARHHEQAATDALSADRMPCTLWGILLLPRVQLFPGAGATRP